MKRMLYVIAFVSSVAMLHAQSMTPIVRLNCTAANYPRCGADVWQGDHTMGDGTHPYGIWWDAQLLLGQGPGGENVVRFHHLPTSSLHEYYVGWVWSNPTGMNPGTTGCRYMRSKFRIVSPLVWNGAPSGRVGGKEWIIGSDGSFDNDRALWNKRSQKNPDHDPTHVMLDLDKNVNGTNIVDMNMVANVWYRAQGEVCMGPNGTAHTATWVNNGNRNSPNGQRTGLTWAPNGWSGSNARVAYGAYWQSAQIGSSVMYDVAAVEFDDQWDPNWHTENTQPHSPAPLSPILIRVI